MGADHWSGRGTQQLDSFQSDIGALRIDWETSRFAGATGPGGLKIVVHSAISGRPLAAPIPDQRGEGKGTVYFSEEPRVFFMEVTSTDVDWKIRFRIASGESCNKSVNLGGHSSRRATGIGRRAALMAGNSPPINPISNA